jgi:RNA polymerase sigma factor (sigma-70 family)
VRRGRCRYESVVGVNVVPQPHTVSGRQKGASGIVDLDSDLVAAAKLDPSAFLELYERYFARVFGYVCVRIADRATCEDVTSQTFTTVLAKLGTFRGRGPFAAWLFQITANTVRKEQRRGRHGGISTEMLGELPDLEAGPEELALERERSAHLRALVSDLRRDQQHLLALRFGAGMGFDEIGSILDIEPGTVRVRVHRIIQELRRRYPHDA